MKVALINSGISNIKSVHNMIKLVGYESIFLNNENDYDENISHLIIPGIGSFDSGIENLKIKGFDQIVHNHISKEKPLLGICLGMQLLTEGSEEGHLPGLSIVSDSCKKFQPSKVFKVPHMGWNYVEPCNSSKLLANIFKPKFYFVHSYFLSAEVKYASSLCDYSINFCSSFEKNNTFGVQFHPEKSHKYGFQLLKNFTDIK
tara:strand:- start:5633 stop:6238 length:606 start_codon:yes stop_codon:yes gene_type:complete